MLSDSCSATVRPVLLLLSLHHNTTNNNTNLWSLPLAMKLTSVLDSEPATQEHMNKVINKTWFPSSADSNHKNISSLSLLLDSNHALIKFLPPPQYKIKITGILFILKRHIATNAVSTNSVFVIQNNPQSFLSIIEAEIWWRLHSQQHVKPDK